MVEPIIIALIFQSVKRKAIFCRFKIIEITNSQTRIIERNIMAGLQALLPKDERTNSSAPSLVPAKSVKSTASMLDSGNVSIVQGIT